MASAIAVTNTYARADGFAGNDAFADHYKNLHLQKMGLGETPGTLRLCIPDGNVGAASFASTGGTRFEDVPVTTLDQFFAQSPEPDIRVVKIDVEGFEPQVFAGGQAFFATTPPDVVVFEGNRQSKEVPESVMMIQSYGYEVFQLAKSLFSVNLVPYQNGTDAHHLVAIHQGASAALRKRLSV